MKQNLANKVDNGESQIASVPPTAGTRGDNSQTEAPNPEETKTRSMPPVVTRSVWGGFLTWVSDLRASDAMMVFLTLVIAATGVVGIVLVVQGGKDTKRLVEAAEKQAEAAQTSADAARGFSDSAAEISRGISDTVAKLQIQAAATQSMALAAAAANTNTLEADRPWMAASISVDGFSKGATPTYTVTFTNTGRRPARVTLTQTMSTTSDFGDKPIYRRYDTTPSTEFVVPGQPVLASWKEASPIPDELMQSLDSGAVPFRIYGEIEYTDARTNAQYWTHVCWRYTPASRTAVNGGFTNCPQYNSAK